MFKNSPETLIGYDLTKLRNYTAGRLAGESYRENGRCELSATLALNHVKGKPQISKHVSAFFSKDGNECSLWIGGTNNSDRIQTVYTAESETGASFQGNLTFEKTPIFDANYQEEELIFIPDLVMFVPDLANGTSQTKN